MLVIGTSSVARSEPLQARRRSHVLVSPPIPWRSCFDRAEGQPLVPGSADEARESSKRDRSGRRAQRLRRGPQLLGVAHSSQNFAPARLSWPQTGQFIRSALGSNPWHGPFCANRTRRSARAPRPWFCRSCRASSSQQPLGGSGEASCKIGVRRARGADSMDTVEQSLQCPHCWQTISMVLDLSVEEQSFVEDCERCCSPIVVSYRVMDGELTQLLITPVQQ